MACAIDSNSGTRAPPTAASTSTHHTGAASSMTVIRDAVRAAEDRKYAAGLSTSGPQQLVFSEGELNDRAIFGGFDIDYDELVATIGQAAAFFSAHAAMQPLIPLFSGCWADGFLVGLMVNSVAPHHDPPGSGVDLPPESGGSNNGGG